MTRLEQQAIMIAVRKEAFKFGLHAAIKAGLDKDTADAVAHAFTARLFDDKLVGRAMQQALDEEIQNHVAP